MNKEEILEKVLYKAVASGFNPPAIFEIELRGYEAAVKRKDYYNIIFDIDFAKAYWGEIGLGIFKTCLCSNCEKEHELYEWMMHLQTMVLYKEPLEYLERFLNE